MIPILIFSFVTSFVFCSESTRCVSDYTTPPVCEMVVYPLNPTIATNSSDFFEKNAGQMIEQLRQEFLSSVGHLDVDCDTYTVNYACAITFPRCLDQIDANSENMGFLPCKEICDNIEQYCNPPDTFECKYEKEYKNTYCTDYGMDSNYWVNILVVFIALLLIGSKDYKRDLEEKIRLLREEVPEKKQNEVIGYEEYSIN